VQVTVPQIESVGFAMHPKDPEGSEGSKTKPVLQVKQNNK